MKTKIVQAHKYVCGKNLLFEIINEKKCVKYFIKGYVGILNIKYI